MVQWVDTECKDIHKMKMTINNLGDDLFLNRLLIYLQRNLSPQVTHIIPIRKHVFKIVTTSEPFILKGFSSHNRLKLQQQFTLHLLRGGFNKTYSFLDDIQKPPLYFDHTYYGCIEYIQASKESFTFQEHENRAQGLELLQQFHSTTAKFVDEYVHKTRQYDLFDRWTKRMGKFLRNLSIIHFFVQKEISKEIIRWANWSLKNLQNEMMPKNHSPVILHGDVAHHNFLRKENGELLLIDFDLISMGDRSYDYLQYANRILPYIDWSFEGLFKLEELLPYLHDKFFLLALVFPTDIFREWNRLILERQYNNPIKVRQVLDLTVEQFSERKIFVKEVMKYVMAAK